MVEALSLIGTNTNVEASSGGLKALFINLTREEQVDFILRKLPKLEFLNGLAVDRDELYSSQEEGSPHIVEDERDDDEQEEREESKFEGEVALADQAIGDIKVKTAENNASMQEDVTLNNQPSNSFDREAEADLDGSGAVPKHRNQGQTSGDD